MAVSKGLRFQVMRRDGYACTYCGARPPDARLVVDHVVPKSLGGSDDPANLTTACSECNGGKAATPADASTVDAVSESNAEFRRIMGQLADEKATDPDVVWFDELWCGFRYSHGSKLVPRPAGWEQSVLTWVGRGLTRQDLDFAVHLAMGKSRIEPDQVFRYMAGTLWKILKEREEQAAELLRKHD